MWAGDNSTLHATYDQAARIGERFGDAQLMAFGRLGVGEALIRSGQTAAGVALFDEVMVAVTTGEVSAIGVGIIYCALIGERNPLQRRFRDVHAITQHVLVKLDTLTTAGAVLVGAGADLTVF
jgi:hypothetical protein